MGRGFVSPGCVPCCAAAGVAGGTLDLRSRDAACATGAREREESFTARLMCWEEAAALRAAFSRP